MKNARPICTGLLLLLAVATSAVRAADPDAEAVAFFEKEVRPLLIESCVKCHGPKKQESGLRLDARAALLQGGDHGPAVVPGKPEESLLVKAVRQQGELQMPPGGKLKGAQIAALVRWIALGAPWAGDAPGVTIRSGAITERERRFWSFQPVKEPPLPEFADNGWVQSPIDRFILAKLQSKGLAPVRPAGKRTLLRRVTFDLTGLPPTPAEIDAFLTDPSPDAFARVVDHLLASPAYGERWGRHWLDVVRYADTAGETADYPVREAYRYRNYVLAAFNQDKPYDEFVREQLAGDLLARDGPREQYAERVTATGYLAIARRFGFDAENYHHLTIQDTIDTLGQSILGLTLGCARCHDHKFDPVTMRDYYALYGIFDSTRYPFSGSEQKPWLRTMAPLLPPAEAQARRETFARELAQLESDLERLKASGPRVRLASLHELDGDFETQAASAGGSLGSLVPPWRDSGRPEVVAAAQSPYTNVYPQRGTVGVRFPGDAGDHAIGQALLAAHGVLHVNLDFRNINKEGDGSYRFYLGHGPGSSAAVEVYVNGGHLFVRNGSTVDTVRPLQPSTWYNLQLTLDLESKTFAGTVGTPGDLTPFSDKAFAPAWDGTLDYLQIDSRGHLPGTKPIHDVDNVAVRTTPLPPLASPTTPEAVPPDPVEKQKAEIAAQRTALLQRGPYEQAYAVAEGTPHAVRIHKRGEPGKLGDEVPRRFPEVLGGEPMPSDAGSGRLQLAQWLTRRENPLTARVLVNRVWAYHFGRGLVTTENDFGVRGRSPTHPELLDWLAARFMADGWSVKALHRRILLSATYQLSCDHNARAAELDPDDELLWRFTRQRLDAEALRDTLLSLGGHLDRSPGQAHPFPAVGVVFTQHAPFSAVYDTNRRSVYLMTQRLKRHPFLALFDGADTNASTAHRSLTTVPTQALFFLNDLFVHEQSNGFARRLLQACPDDAGRIELAYTMALARPPRDEERQRGVAFLERYRQQLQAPGVPAEQQALLTWAAYARTLFAANEFLFLD
jgi:mono/diheme cytochrome c family protein